MEKKLKVVWICGVNNHTIRENCAYSISLFEKFFRFLVRKTIVAEPTDSAQWITNGIEEMKKYNEIELHVVSPQFHLAKKYTTFCKDGIYYHLFCQQYSILRSFLEILIKPKKHSYRMNTNRISSIINKINPDIINLYGAENPSYAIAVLDQRLSKYPLLVTLQTLMNHPTFMANKGMSEHLFSERANVEKLILQHTNYISTGVVDHGKHILGNINPNAYIFKGSLALGETIDTTICGKEYDFVFFASNVSKGLVEAVESFILVKKKKENVSMNIIGGISDVQRNYVYDKLKVNQIDDSAIIISGRLKTHDDVLNQIKKANIAVIPLKVDSVSGTIREAISRGVPVVSTITKGTPLLNEKRESILLSKIGDYQAMADNMTKLLDFPEYANIIRENAFVTLEEKYNNNAIINSTIATYNAIVAFHKEGTPIPEDIGQISKFA